jgi:hypothetical protein
MGLAVGAVLGVLLAAGGASAQPDIRPNPACGSDQAQRLDLCVPAANGPACRLAVVMIHGG